jgi:CRP-like cAMP-binding protein
MQDCAWKSFKEDEVILNLKDHSSDVYFIISGRVRLAVHTPDGEDVIIGDLGPGQFFGEMAAIDGVKRSAKVTALTNVELSIMPAPIFKSLVLSSPEICERLIKLLTQRVRETNMRLL